MMLSTTPSSAGEGSSCYFPNLRPPSVESNSNIEIEPSCYSVAIQLDLGLDIELFCDNGAIPAEIFFQLVWALVLRCFAGKDDVAFDFIDTSGNHVSKVHTTIDEENSALEAAHALQVGQVKNSSTNVNTLLCLSRDEAEATADPSSLGSRLQDIHSNYDVTVDIDLSDDDVSIYLQCATNISSRDSVMGVASTLARTLHRILDQPHQLPSLMSPIQELSHVQILLPVQVDPIDNHETKYGTWVSLEQVEKLVSINLPGLSAVKATLYRSPNSPTHRQVLVVFLTLSHQEEAPQEELILDERAHVSSGIEELRRVLSNSLQPRLGTPALIPLSHMPHTPDGQADYSRLISFFSTLPQSRSSHADETWVRVSSPSNTSDGVEVLTDTEASGEAQHLTQAEEKMRLLWSEVLSVSVNQIRTEDSFFLYGDSASAMNLVSAAIRAGLALTVADVFITPTLGELSANTLPIGEGEMDNELNPFELLSHQLSTMDIVRSVAEQCDVEARTIVDVYPTTALQEGLYALSFTEKASYVFQCVCKLPASLNLKRFKFAWETAIQEFPILRTRIVYHESTGTLQTVLSQESVEWRSGNNLSDYLAQDKAISIEYGSVLARFAIVSQPQQDSYFVWTIHHALYDAWSMSLILDAVDRLYEEPGYSLTSFVPFNRFVKHVADPDAAQSKGFWVSYLANANGTPFPSSPPNTTRDKGRSHNTLTSSLNLQRTTASNITIATIVRASWGAVVARYCDSNDVVFGTTLSGRNAPVKGIGEIVGPTIATVPVRATIDRSHTFAQHLQRTQDEMIAMIPFEHVGLQTIKQWGQDAMAACGFQNLLVVQLAPDVQNGKRHTGLDFSLRSTSGSENYSIMVECTLTETGIDIHIEFDQDTISKLQMERVLRQFEHVLLQLNTESPSKTMEDLELVSSFDIELIETWNNQDLPEKMACIHELFEDIVEKQPDAPAICSWDGDFSYSQLDRLSTKLALHLQNLGVGPESIIAIMFEKSAWAHVAQLAILKAGGAVVCLDPGHPEGRIKRILSDVGAVVVLTTNDLSSLFQGIRNVVTVDADSIERISRLNKPNQILKREVQPRNAALVIYTSGSTGEPKGVVLEHVSICTGMQAHGDALKVGPKTRALNFSAYVFDASLEDIYTQLTRGGCICVPSESQRLNDLHSAIQATRANWIGITPTTAATLDPNTVPTIDTLILGGELITQKVVDQWKDHVTYMYNGYGPCESTLYATLNPQLGKNGKSSNVGHGLHTKLWIVEPGNPDRLAPVGCSGELLLEGPLLARYYLNDTTKTETAFVANPAFTLGKHTTEHPRRMYRTGDLVRYDDDGSLVVLGRIDSQVKIHGQRLELGEIEQNLRNCSDVNSAMAILATEPSGTKRIMAILSLQGFLDVETIEKDNFRLITRDQRQAAEPIIGSIRKQLQHNLPNYMVPTIWAAVNFIPRNTSQKLDRARMVRWANSLDQDTYSILMGDDSESENITPDSPVAARLRSVIARVLNKKEDQLSMNRSFANVGGDSITAMQVVSRCRAEGLRLFVKDILHSESLAQLSQIAETMDSTKGNFRVQGEEINRAFALSPVQQFYFEANQKPTQFNQSFLLKITRSLPVSQIKAAVEAAVNKHSMLRARFFQQGDSWYQQITTDVGASFRFRTKDLDSEDQVAQAFLECQQGLDVESGPLLGVDVLICKDGSQFLALAAHHLIIDFVSWRIVLKDFEDFLTTGALVLDKTLSFQTWVKLQAEYAHEHLDPQFTLPFDVASSDFRYWGMVDIPNVYGDTACHTFFLDQDTTRSIFHECNSAFDSEPIDILTAAAIHSFNQVFSDRQTPTVWKEAHGRETWDADIDLSSVVGWFTNLAPLHIAVSADDDIVSTLRTVKDTSRKLPQNGWQYFTSRYLTKKGRELFKDHSPIELLFNYVGRFQQLENDDGLFVLQEPQTEEIEPAMGRQTPRMSLLEISISHTSDGKLKFRLMYNERMAHIDRLYAWAAVYDRTLREAVATLRGRNPEKTLSDFPLMRFNYKGLNVLRNERIQELGLEKLDDIENLYPTAPMQEALLVGQALHPGTYETNATLEVTTTNRQKPVDVDRLQAAWETVVAYHPMLRTVFTDSIAEEGLFDQVVLKSFKGVTQRIHCENESGPATLMAMKYMDLSKKRPLHRFVICTTPSGRVYCRMDFHHATIDATSLRVLLDDIRLAYDGGLHLENQPQFSEYIKYLQTKSITNALDYWEDRLSSAGPCHFPVASSHDDSGKEMRELEADLHYIRPLLRNFISRTGVTLPNLVQTAWALVLQNYSGLDSVSFGTLVSGRNVDVKDVDRIVGPLINMLVCNVDTTSSANVVDLLHSTRDNYAESLDHQHVSLGRVQHAIGLSAATPLFNTAMSSLHNSSTISKFQSRNAQAKRRELFFDVMHFHDPTEYDIIFTLKADDHNPNITFAYWSPRISDWIAKNALSALTKVIRSLIDVASVDGMISELEYFSKRDEELVQQWNNDPVPEENVCIHHIIEQRMKSTPHAEAICNAHRSMTYAELDGFAIKLAAELQRRGVGPEVVVPICFEKSPWALVSILACLKAGGAYVPLDPSHPEFRLRQIIESKGVRGDLLLTSETQAGLFTGFDCEVIFVNEETCQNLPTTPLAEGSVTPKNLAYVIFTSGTTGKPKGTMIEHRAFATSARDHSKKMGINSSSRVLQFSSYVFDVSVMDMLTTLMQGGTVCIPTEEEKGSLEIVGAMNRMRVNWVLFTPSFASIIEPSSVRGLKTLVLGGEAMSKKHVETWAPHVRLMNAYGPTEASVLVTINTDVFDHTNIGHGVGALTWVADRTNSDRLVSVGAVGELLLEGPTLARGYLNEPAKTRAAFIDSPSWAPGRRFYKTGDLVRQREDGAFTYLGRKDSQVKVRGQRLEIGEIEHHLDTSRLVRDAVVVMPTAGPRQKSLVAVVTLTALRSQTRNPKPLQVVDQSLQAGHVRELGDFLGQTLPSYMVPAVWIVVEAMPLNTSGKLDRKRVVKWVERLGTDFYHRIAADENLTAGADQQPATDMESKIRELVSTILNIPSKQLSMVQSFIGLGGDSITAMQMVSRCRQEGITLKMSDILRSKSILKMAQAAKAMGSTQIQRTEEISEKPFDLSPIQQMFEDMGGIPDMRFNQSFYLRVSRPIVHKELEKAIATICQRHSMLRARYIKGNDGKWQQLVKKSSQGCYHTASHDLRSTSLAVPIMQSAQHRLHPNNGPLFSVDLINITGEGQFLYLVAHHLVIDLVSWRVILSELEQLLLGRSLPSSDSIPFQSWLALQSTYVASLDVKSALPFKVQSTELAYWDMEGKSNIYADVERHELSLAKDVSTKLIEKCHIALGTEPVELLLAALFHSFAIVFPDRATPTVFSEGHGREPWDSSMDVNGTVGWFTTMSPLHIPVFGDTVVDVVRRVKDMRRSVPRNGFDYFAMRYLSASGRENFGNSGPMEVLFNYLGQYQQLERGDSLLSQQALPDGATQSDFDEKLTRFALFEISATVSRGIISLQFLYNKNMARKADILRWADTCAQSLRSITELLPNLKREKTLNDFPLVPLTYDALRELHDDLLPELGLSNMDDIEDIYPVTPMQAGLILSQIQDPGTYKTTFTFKLTPSQTDIIDFQRLLAAWQIVVDSHAMLRTVFTDRILNNGVYYQLVLARSTANVTILNCINEEEAISLLASSPPLEYNDSSPPHRLTVCQTASDTVFLKFEASHALVDADSVGVLLRDLSRAYETKKVLDVSPLYSDYIRYLNSRSIETSLSYWKDYLHRVNPCYLPMINDQLDTTSPLRSIHLSLGKLSTSMRRFCKSYSVTMPSVFHLAWSVVLRLYTGVEDVTYGYLVSGRDLPVAGIQSCIGPFINLMVSRTHLSASSTIASLAQMKQAEYATSLEHQGCSLAQIQHSLGLADQPLFNTMISIQALSNKKTGQDWALAFEGIGSHDPTEYDISLGIYSDDENAEAHLGYWADRMSDWQAENIAHTFEKVLERLLSRPESNVDSLRRLSERDASQIELWTPPNKPASHDLVHDLFSQQVTRSPGSMAIEGFDGSFTYSQLNDVAARFSQRLSNLGVRPGSVVAFCFCKSAWAIVTMLATLKAGGTCLPLSPDHPLERVRAMLEDSNTSLIVCAPDQAGRLQPLGTKVISFSEEHASKLEAASATPVSIHPESSAFLIYTSGSTGIPKGVEISHRAITTNVPELARAWGWNERSRILQYIAYTFDPMLGDIFGTLFIGACLCLISDEDRMKDITPVLNGMEISNVVLTPSLARTLQPGKLTTLKSLVCGGEAITERDIEMWKGHVELINAYGPTEATIAVTSLRYSERKSVDPRNIGRPLAFSSLFVADPENIQYPVPVGAVGELLIGGFTLANGYLNDTVKTQKAFFQAPGWTKRTGSTETKVYRTGDLVRWSFDGTIHFIGRADSQIKIRGQRVEAGEIEHVIKSNLPGLNDIAVALTTPRGRSTDPVLTAFLNWDTDTNSQDKELLTRLAEPLVSELMSLDLKLADSLPSYMIPSMYIPLNYIPLTISGKTDMSQLQTLVTGLDDSDLAHYSLSDGPRRKPSTRTEKKLAIMWSELLNLNPERIGLDDSFFRLGGDSLSAIRLTSRASDDDIHLTIALIFQNPKLCDMATAANKLFSKKIYEQLEEQYGIRKESVSDIYPCTPLQESLMVLSMKKPGYYHQRYSWDLPKSTKIDLLRRSFQIVSLDETILRTRIVNLDSVGSLQLVHAENIDATEVESEDAFWKTECSMPMTYGQPLIKYSIMSNIGKPPKILLVIHHALYDEWSINLLLNKIQIVYNNLEHKLETTVEISSPRFCNYADFVTQCDLDEARTYWGTQLLGASPVDFPRLPSASYQPGKRQIMKHEVQLPEKKNMAFGVPVLLKAAWTLLLCRYTGAHDITFGLTVQGRDAPVAGISSIIGPTLATIPFRMHIDFNSSVEQLVRNVHDKTNGLKPFEHVGLQQITRSASEAESACKFQHLLLIHEKQSPSISADFWRKTSVDHAGSASVPYPLIVEFYINESTVELVADYDEAVLDADQLEFIWSNFEHTLDQLSTALPDKLLKSLVSLSTRDQDAIVHLNRTMPVAQEARVDEIFERQRLARPDADAIHSWDARLTYQQLYKHAICLGHYLQKLGVGPETIVPLLFDKSAWTIVSMLGVIYAGGAFVVMDATHPTTRLQQIIEDTKAAFILASSSRADLGCTIAPQVVIVSAETVSALPDQSSPPINMATSRSTAYVLFTSGSTGRPKGVVTEHRGICTAALEQGKRIDLHPRSRVLQYASYAFESSILEILHTLFHGGTICVISHEERFNDMVGAINRLKANWAFFTPSLVRTLQPEQIPYMKTIVLGGEALGADNIEVWANKTHLANGYGPTETCVFSSILDHITDNDRPDNIGHAVGGKNWVVDPDDHDVLVPVGAVGELVVEGPTVARGYLNDQSKTDQVFVKQPVWLSEKALGRPIGRSYKTGDLVTMRPDGTTFYISRKDTQVKIRGQRVELGEIEHGLKQYLPSLTHLAVDQVHLPGRNNTEMLAAFLCKDGKEKEDEPQVLRIDSELYTELVALTSTITDALPAYMVPTLYVLLDSMPLSSSGKTDRRRLQAVAQRLSDEEIAHFSLSDVKKKAPVTDVEKKMQSMWATVLSIPVESVGLEDSFVRLGGDSLAAMRLASLARNAGISLLVNEIFSNPTLSAMSSTTTRLKEESTDELKPFSLLRGPEPLEAILEKLDTIYGIPRKSILDIYPTSSLQEGLMALSVRQPGTYNFQWVSALPSTVDRERFKQSWQLCVKRNTILRTRIIYTELSGSLQVVLDDESQWTTSGTLKAYLKSDKLDAMDYGKPLTRWAIVDDENGKAHFVWSAHHSIYDGWALPLILQEVARIYHANGSSQLPTIPPYGRFIEYLESREHDVEVAYWQAQFREGKVLSHFPPVQSSAIQPLANITVTKEFKFASKTPSVSGFTTSTYIRAAWAIVLARYAEADNALFGCLLAGRNVPIKDIAFMTGPTITTVPVHVTVQSEQTVNTFLQEVQQQAVEMMPFEHTGLQNIKQFTSETREACNFQNLLVIQPKRESNEAEDLWRTGDTIDFAFDEFLTYPLVFQVELGSTLGLTLKLDDRILTAERGQRMLEHFSHVMNQLLEAESQTLSELDIVCPADIAEIQHWNEDKTEVEPFDRTVHDLISNQAACCPDAVAVCSWDEELTYAELDHLSTRVALHLKTLGIGLETYVLFSFDKSAFAIVAMLGILKAGAAYVAVDPMHPPDRKAFIARDVSATVAVTGPQHQHMFSSLVDHVVPIDRSTIEMLDSNATLSLVPSSNPAFVVFTSGSTGIPKGIIMEHGAFAIGARSHAPALQIDQNARVLQFAAYTYDVSMGEIFSTLMHGGTVCVPSEEERLSNLAAAINRFSANWLFLTPTVASLLQPDSVPSLRHLVLGGEHATTANFQAWADHVYLTNSYGPAECAIWTNCAPGVHSNSDPSNIGHRIGSKLHIVEADNHDKLTPQGCVGELVVESLSLARGYNDPEKTRAAFIVGPKWAGADRRMYKTGDLATYNFDGTISIVGRKDNQVKLNGQRMELGEVEHHLWADSDVEKAMAIVPNAGLCKKHLVSVVSLRSITRTQSKPGFVLVEGNHKKETGMAISRLREALASKLPKYMVPTVWIVLEDLPLNASGKLDRKAVAEWVKTMNEETYRNVIELAQSDKAKTQPSNKMEAMMRKLWSKVLGVSEESIGIEDNFLQSGGDSISAVRLTAAARQEGITLLVRDIFQKPVLRVMSTAAKWEESADQVTVEPFSIFKKEEKQDALRSIVKWISQPAENIEDVIEATDYQSWTLSAGHLRTRGYMNYFSIRFGEDLDVEKLKTAYQSVITRHPILRTVFVIHKRRLLQVILKTYAPEHSLYELQDNDGDESMPQTLIQEDMKRPVNLGDSILRFTLVKQTDNSHRLILRLSHAQYDGISLPSILQDIKASYEGTELPASTPFSTFVYRTRGQNSRQSETYWAELLKDSNMTNVLHHKRLPYKNPVDRMLSRTVSPEAMTAEGITFASIVKAAWALVLSSLAATSDTVFGQIVSGRNSLTGIQDVVGPCMNILPVRVPLQPIWTNADLARFVQDQHLASMPHENLGMQRIIENCTAWSKKTRFSSIYQHTNFGRQFFGEVLSASSGSQMTGYSPPHDVADVWIWTAPVSDGKFSVDFSFADGIVSDEVAQLMLNMLCQNIEDISNNQDSRVKVPIMNAVSLPIVYDDKDDKDKHLEETLQQGQRVSSSTAADLVESAWKEVFGVEEGEDHDREWWDFRGDRMAAVHLAELYGNVTGVKISVEKLIDHATKAEQLKMLEKE